MSEADDVLREMARNRGCTLVKSRVRTPGRKDYGHFGLKDAKTGKPVFGIGKSGLTATREDIETFLRGGAAAEWKSSVGAVYDDPASSQRSVMFFGGTGVLLAPDKELASAFGLLDDKSGAVRDIHSVPPGPLGGEMKCGTSTGDGGDMAVCGWADHGSIALAFFPGRTLDDAAALMRQIRDGVQHRG